MKKGECATSNKPEEELDDQEDQEEPKASKAPKESKGLKMNITIPIPKAEEAGEGGTATVEGESETFYGTKFRYMIQFSGQALVTIQGKPPKPNLRPKIKPIRLKVNKRYKALYAKIGPEKIKYVNTQPPAKGKFTIDLQNNLPELEQMIWDIEHM